MPLPPGGRVVTTWQEMNNPVRTTTVIPDEPTFLSIPRTYRRQGTYLATVTTYDAEGNLCAQSGVALWLYRGRARYLELWRRPFGATVPAVNAAVGGALGTSVTISMA